MAAAVDLKWLYCENLDLLIGIRASSSGAGSLLASSSIVDYTKGLNRLVSMLGEPIGWIEVIGGCVFV